MVDLYLLIILYFYNINIIYADSAACEPYRIYKFKNITCPCNENGDWSNEECRLNFQSLKSQETRCEPGTFRFIDCNVCRCGKNGKVDRKQCTKHDCKAAEKSRRSDSLETRCEPKRWYSFAPCRICYCVKEDKLICNNNYKGVKVIIGEYELHECGENLMLDMKELKSGKKPLRYGDEKVNYNHKKDTKSIVQSDEFKAETEDESNAKYGQLTANKAKTKHLKAKDLSKSEKSKVKKHKLSKVTSPADDWQESKEDESLTNNQMLRIKLPNVLDNLLNLVLRKSMVSLNPGNNCKTGSTVKVECNTCFCLANGKMLCTEKKCK